MFAEAAGPGGLRLYTLDDGKSSIEEWEARTQKRMLKDGAKRWEWLNRWQANLAGCLVPLESAMYWLLFPMGSGKVSQIK
jgi:hypothetical protein